MVVLDADGTVVATSVDALLGRDFADRDYFRAPQAAQSPATLHVAVAVQDLARQLHDRLRPGDRRARTAPSPAPPIAALEPEYFEVLMRSVLYAPDMWVSLGHSNGKVFVTMPRDNDPARTDWQPPRIGGDERPAPLARAPW